MKTPMNILLGSLIVAVLSFQAFSPVPAYADGETPPSAGKTPEGTDPPEPEEAVTEVTGTESPAQAETSLPIPPREGREPKRSSSAPVETPPAEEAAAPGEMSLAEALQELPDETNAIVLDENGQPVPLVTTEAAEIIEASDPMWCPEGVAPIANTGGCTDSYSSMTALLAALSGAGQPTQDGTIWIESGNIAESGPIEIDGCSSYDSYICTGYTNWSYYSLTLQGGWGGTTNSVFTVPITLSNWNGDITINNITVDGAAGDGLTINRAQDVTINSSTFTGNAFSGAYIYSVNVLTIDSSTFSGNAATGAFIWYAYDVTIDSSTFTGNDYDGVSISYVNDVTIDNSTLTGNDYGAIIWGAKGATIDSSTLTENASTGAYIVYVTDVAIDKSTFTGNDTGVKIFCVDAITFNPNQESIIFGNTTVDLFIDPTCGSPDIKNINPTSQIQNQGVFELNCSGQSSFTVNLPNGDIVYIFCPVSGTAEIYRIDNTTLPAELPAGYTYASAFTLDILQGGEPIPVITEGGYIQASFVAQPLGPGNSYAVLYWDKATESWMELEDFYQKDDHGNPRSFPLLPGDPEDGRIILSGVKLDTKDTQRVEVLTNFPGIFVLAQH